MSSLLFVTEIPLPVDLLVKGFRFGGGGVDEPVIYGGRRKKKKEGCCECGYIHSQCQGKLVVRGRDFLQRVSGLVIIHAVCVG